MAAETFGFDKKAAGLSTLNVMSPVTFAAVGLAAGLGDAEAEDTAGEDAEDAFEPEERAAAAACIRSQDRSLQTAVSVGPGEPHTAPPFVASFAIARLRVT